MNKRHWRGRELSVLLMLLGLATAPPFLSATEPGVVAKAVRPLQVKLMRPLDAGHLKDGATFRVRVLAEWEDEGCHLKPDQIVEGRVAHVVKHSKTEIASQFQMSLEAAACAELKTKPMAFTLVALVGASLPDDLEMRRLMQGPPLADTPTGPQSGARSFHSPSEVQNAVTNSENASYSQSQVQKYPAKMAFGQVLNAPLLSLRVGAGDERATVLVASHGDARIEANSVLIMVPSSGIESIAKAGDPAIAADVPRALPVGKALEHKPDESEVVAAPVEVKEPPYESEVCSSACVTLSSLEESRVGNSRSTASLPIRRYGFAPHQRFWAFSFNHETTLTFLSEHRLLCTFDPHRLRLRSRDGSDATRDIRAVVIDPATRRIQRVVEWHVNGDDTYLWRYGHGNVLVHMGRTLRLFDQSLRTIKSIPVEGSVAWVVSSPSNDHTAIGLVKLQEGTAGPSKTSDDLQVNIYDSHWNKISQVNQSPDLAEPILSDNGELRYQRIATEKWKILQYSWDRTEQTLATVHSSCSPLISAQENGMTFVTGCADTHGRVWYRMLDSEGHTLFKGESLSDEMAQMAESTTKGTFAIRLIRTARSVMPNGPFSPSDLLQERISVFRSQDGKRMGQIATDDFILAQDSFALSPAGDEMAVVGKEAIFFYKLGER